MPGDVTYLEPGRDAPVVLEADGSGNVPQYGDLVGIVGESERGTHVSFAASAGNTIGHLVGEVADVDEDATFGANEVVGSAMVKVRAAVDWFSYDDSGGWDQTATDPTTTSPSAGDLAVGNTSGGVVQYDSASQESAIGPVFTTLQRAEGTADKVAVVRHR